MPIPVQQFPILSSQQANPLGMGLQKGMSLIQQYLINKYLPERLQQEAQQRQLTNETNQVNLQNLPDLLKQQLLSQQLNNQLAQMKVNNPFLISPEGALYGYALQQQNKTGDNQNPNASPTLNNNLLSNILANKFMSPEQKAQLQLQQAAKIGTVKQNIKDYTKEFDQAHIEANLANTLSNLTNQFSNSYDNLNDTEKGPLAGRLPAFSSNAQLADNAAKNMQATLAKLVASGRVTNYEMQFVGDLKLNRTLTQDAKNVLNDFFLAKANREKEYPSFLVAARKKGIDAQTAKALWDQYNEQFPVYNFEKRKINQNNKNQYNRFLTPQAVNTIETNQTDLSYSNQINNNKPKIVVLMPDGSLFRIDADKLNEAVKRGAKQVG